jgi:NADH dehydrogenase FAD-containing subunit
MKLATPAALNERLRQRAAQLDRLADALSRDVAVWRARFARHRVAVAIVGGGIAGVAVAARWRSLLRLATVVIGATVRTTALSMLARARVERAVQEELARARRTT